MVGAESSSSATIKVWPASKVIALASMREKNIAADLKIGVRPSVCLTCVGGVGDKY